MANDNTFLIQTRIQITHAKWLKRAAKRDGITVAAYVRRLIMRAAERSAILVAAEQENET